MFVNSKLDQGSYSHKRQDHVENKRLDNPLESGMKQDNRWGQNLRVTHR